MQGSAWKGYARHLAGMLITFVAIGVPVYFIFARIANPPGAWAELAKANPGFHIDRVSTLGLLIVTGAAQKRYFLSDHYAGDFAMEPVACREVPEPDWFRLPPDARGETCLRAGEVMVLNFVTDMKIPELAEFYGPLAQSTGMSGGYSISDGEIGPDGLLRRGASMNYRVGDTVRITAYYLSEETLGIVYFEPER